MYLNVLSFLHTGMSKVVEIISYLFLQLVYIDSITGSDALAPCVARVSATMTLSTLNRNNSVPAHLLLILTQIIRHIGPRPLSDTRMKSITRSFLSDVHQVTHSPLYQLFVTSSVLSFSCIFLNNSSRCHSVPIQVLSQTISACWCSGYVRPTLPIVWCAAASRYLSGWDQRPVAVHWTTHQTMKALPGPYGITQCAHSPPCANPRAGECR